MPRSKPWKVKLQHASNHEVTHKRLIKGGTSIKTAHGKLAAALADPSCRKEVAMLTSRLLSAKAAHLAFKRQNVQDLQFLYYLTSARTTFDRAGVRYRIICNPWMGRWHGGAFAPASAQSF